MNLKEFRSHWKPLSDQDKDIVKAMSIAYEPLNKRDTVKLVNTIGVRTSSGLKFSTTNIRPYILKLMTDGFITEDRQGKYSVALDRREWVMRMAVIDERFKEFVRQIRNIFPYSEWSYAPRSFNVAKRDLRIAYYQGDLSMVEDIIRDIYEYYLEEWMNTDFYGETFEPFDPKWLSTFPQKIQGIIINGLLARALVALRDTTPYIKYIEESSVISEQNALISTQLFTYYLLKGDLEAIAELNDKTSSDAIRLIRLGVLAFLKGQNKEALEYFTKGAKLSKKEGASSAKYISTIEGIFHVFALLNSQDKKAFSTAMNYVEKVNSAMVPHCFETVSLILYHQENKDIRGYLNIIRVVDSIQGLILGLVYYWSQYKPSDRFVSILRKYYTTAIREGYDWLAINYAELLEKLDDNEKNKRAYADALEILRKKLSVISLLPLIKRTEPWQRSLNALSILKLKGKKGKTKTDEDRVRMVWLVDFNQALLQPKEQKLGKTGKWSKGRNVSLSRFKNEGISSATEQDDKVKKSIKRYNSYYGQGEYEIDFYNACKELVGHPLLFMYDNPSISLELIAKEPDLVIEELDDQYAVRFVPEFDMGGISIVKETPTRYILMNVTENHLNIQNLLGDTGRLKIPKEAKSELIQAVSHVSTAVTVQSVVGGMGEDLPEIEGDATICVHLLPIGDGFKLEFFVKPFRVEPPYFKPSAGRSNVIAEVEGVKTIANRNLALEKQNAEAVINACPALMDSPEFNMEWAFEEVEDCLQVLLELEPLREAGTIILEYPKGERVKIVGQASFGNMSMVANKKGNWFELDGEVKISEDRVMDFSKMLALADQNDSRFIEVSKGQFVALTEQLRQKLGELNSMLHKTKNSMQLHPLAAGVLDDFSDELAEFKTDKKWKENRNRLQEALSIEPKVPSTFEADLRDYQQDGFKWLSQLAHWGVGACLADDMGLGKTVQSLALILSRMKEGPAMVVAPASVARNWLREAEKFAPTINPILFGQGDRIQTVADLKPFDLLITSYGLMQQESELLATTTFSTLVLDEAQAIKNRATKRSKAAMELQANFRVATTGTPIENHLGELWNLFNFLNPGLLGSLQRFNEKFAIPIERYENKEKRQQLRKLLQPFILRRRKSEVLSELPPKTEVTLTVEMSPEERAFYEALRRKAVDKIESTEGFGAKRFQILAELMRLRQACCNIKMIQPESNISSSKLELFAETVKEIVENGHKALVFSQFVKHLRLIEEWVQANNISYQYLDGQTPLPKREEAINAFQAGESDLFLISLKAGGTGLNLTEADYVLHLDPWWNPAVEDQASDRAHRIGQQRPVTIYRLVAEGTIEEKIVQLHAEKRDLADSLLEGTESSAKMGAEELLDLIKGA